MKMSLSDNTEAKSGFSDNHKNVKVSRNYKLVLRELKEALLYWTYGKGNEGYHIESIENVESFGTVLEINRKYLRMLIGKATGINYRAGIYALIEQLQANHILFPNPDWTEHQLESNYSQYIINIGLLFNDERELEFKKQIFEARNKYAKKSVRDTQSTLDKLVSNSSN
jgi:hypothetical protein